MGTTTTAQGTWSFSNGWTTFVDNDGTIWTCSDGNTVKRFSNGTVTTFTP